MFESVKHKIDIPSSHRDNIVTMYVFMFADCDEIVYAHDDLRCVIRYILDRSHGWFAEYDEESYDSIGFDWRHPFDNDLETWNRLLEGEGCVIRNIVKSSDVFDETYQIEMPCIVSGTCTVKDFLRCEECREDSCHESESAEKPVVKKPVKAKKPVAKGKTKAT